MAEMIDSGAFGVINAIFNVADRSAIQAGAAISHAAARGLAVSGS